MTLPPDLMISAARRAAELNGASLFVRQKGDADNGGILVKINLLNGTAKLIQRVTQEDGLVWHDVIGDIPQDDALIEQKVAQFLRYDPDLWVIEIEDRKGRLWLDLGMF